MNVDRRLIAQIIEDLNAGLDRYNRRSGDTALVADVMERYLATPPPTQHNQETRARREFNWWGKEGIKIGDEVDTVMFGLYAMDKTKPYNGPLGEMRVEWNVLIANVVPRLCVYDDGWEVLATFGDLLEKMARHNDENMAPEEFVKMLKECGFVDTTRYQED